MFEFFGVSLKHTIFQHVCAVML